MRYALYVNIGDKQVLLMHTDTYDECQRITEFYAMRGECISSELVPCLYSRSA